jgi:hypothetical protein
MKKHTEVKKEKDKKQIKGKRMMERIKNCYVLPMSAFPENSILASKNSSLRHDFGLKRFGSLCRLQ